MLVMLVMLEIKKPHAVVALGRENNIIYLWGKINSKPIFNFCIRWFLCFASRGSTGSSDAFHPRLLKVPLIWPFSRNNFYHWLNGSSFNKHQQGALKLFQTSVHMQCLSKQMSIFEEYEILLNDGRKSCLCRNIFV